MGKITVFILLSIMIFSSCKKPEVKGNAMLEQYFENNILNKDIIITYAKDGTGEITPVYSDYIFVLLKTDMYHGPLKVSKGNLKYEGAWSSNDDYSKLTIELPDTPVEFDFLTSDWRFTSKAPPKLKLAPWGSTEDIVLHMEIQ